MQYDNVLLRPLNSTTQAEIDRLAGVIFNGPDNDCRAILFTGADDPGGSSEWVVLHMAHTLAVSGKRAHAIFLQPRIVPVWNKDDKTFALSDQCKAEWISETDRHTDLARIVAQHLVETRKHSALALVHLKKLVQSPEVLSCAGLLDGAVLLVRSGHTRKASLSYINRQLAAAKIAVLGGILTDQP